MSHVEETKMFKDLQRKSHLTFAWLVVVIFPLWSIFDYFVINRFWNELFIFRIASALVISFTALLTIFNVIQPLVLGYTFSIILYAGVGVPLAFLNSSEIPLWCLGYCTCFITCSFFQFWPIKHHFICLGVSALIVCWSFFQFGFPELSHSFAAGMFMVASVVAASVGFFIVKMNLETKNIKLVANLEKSNQSFVESQKEISTIRSELAQKEKLAALGMLASGVAHQLGNTLNVLSTCLVAVENLSEKNGIVEDRIQQCTKRGFSAIELSKDIIDAISYVGKTNDVFKENNLFKLIESSKVLVKGKSLERVRIDNFVDPNFKVFCSRSSLTQVFMNLLSNAIDAVPHEGGNVSVSAKKVGTFIEIRVTDSGTGIPENIKETIFQPYVTSKSAEEGTGLGLFLVKREIERHHGKVTFESSNKGTTFIVSLPEEGAKHG